MFNSIHACQTMIVPLWIFNKRFAVKQWKGMLHQRKRKWRIGNSRSITSLAYKQEIAYQQTFFERRTWNLVVLKQKRIDKIHRH